MQKLNKNIFNEWKTYNPMKYYELYNQSKNHKNIWYKDVDYV